MKKYPKIKHSVIERSKIHCASTSPAVPRLHISHQQDEYHRTIERQSEKLKIHLKLSLNNGQVPQESMQLGLEIDIETFFHNRGI